MSENAQESALPAPMQDVPNGKPQKVVPRDSVEDIMNSRIQELASQINMSCDEFVGEMRKRGCSEPTALKIWRGGYEDFNEFEDNDILLSNLRKAADVLKVRTSMLLPK